MKKILITGVFGFLGTQVLHFYKNKNYYIAGIGRSSQSENPDMLLLDNYCIDDITMDNLESFSEKFDVIIHCAGSGSVGKTIENPLKEFHNTVEATHILLEYIRLKQPNARVVFSSSAAVYGSTYITPIKESEMLDSMSLYGVHKELCEKLFYSYSKLYKIKISVIRFFSIYGQGLKKQLLWDVCNKTTKVETNTLVFFGTGKEIRDFIEVEDALSLIDTASLVSEDFIVINGGMGHGKSVEEVIRHLAKLLLCQTPIVFNQQVRKGDPTYLCADITKAINYGWKPMMTLEKGLENYVKWYKKQN